MNIVGDLILKSLLPKTKLAIITAHQEDIKDMWLAQATYE
jgi:hypothetical protein